jgi:hypothetical protein
MAARRKVQDWGEGIGRAEMIGFGLPARLSRVLHRAKFAPDPEYRQGKTPMLQCDSPTPIQHRWFDDPSPKGNRDEMCPIVGA